MNSIKCSFAKTSDDLCFEIQCNEKLLNIINNINNIKLLNIVLKDKGTLENDLNKYVWFYKAQDRTWHTIAPRCHGPCVPLILKNSHRLLSSIALSHFVSMCQLLSKIYLIKRKLIFFFHYINIKYIISAFTINSTGLKEKLHGQQQDLSFQYANSGPLKDSQIHFKW